MIKSRKIMLVVVVLTAWAGVAMATETDPAKCLVCHNGKMAVKLDTITSERIAERLVGYKSGKLTGTLMAVQAKALSDSDIKALSIHLGKK